MRAAPAVSCALMCKKCAHEHTGEAETLRPSLRNGFTVYSVLSLVTGLSCHHRSRVTPQTWRQRRGVRTTRLHRPQQQRSSTRRDQLTSPKDRPATTLRANAVASTASRPAFVTIASRPSVGQDQIALFLLLPKRQAKIRKIRNNLDACSPPIGGTSTSVRSAVV